MEQDFGEFPSVFLGFFGLVAAFIVVVVVMIVVSLARSRRVLRDSGLDPLAAPAEVAVRLARGPLAAPVRSLEQRLAELDDLHRRGVITDAEHDAGRRAALTER
ncbi:hypothetical protein [Blastococcus goldschmidtiae]|uniref:Short C-terminal domain-containing protein n=1 Tax=Blastococcus goldschmidtiae TaxID=3075546 RepID=A0ABU2KDJ8_9ACTN|nr:hypothetical protein [Blastococcus sp. DSM 46792]MDT0278265.1 hypothetical protein [Blastococcus sp. DSM 46792]